MRRSMNAALKHFKWALKRHLQSFVALDEIGANSIIVPQDQKLQFMAREMQLQGMREVLGITDTDLERIYTDLGPQYRVHLDYSLVVRINDKKA